jgi:VIT1/CCC1 family predicted Fe2+/Mn2+ transporter
MTAVAFLVVGALKGRFVGAAWYRSAIESVVLGGCAALLAFAVGVALKGLAA